MDANKFKKPTNIGGSSANTSGLPNVAKSKGIAGVVKSFGEGIKPSKEDIETLGNLILEKQKIEQKKNTDELTFFETAIKETSSCIKAISNDSKEVDKTLYAGLNSEDKFDIAAIREFSKVAGILILSVVGGYAIKESSAAYKYSHAPWLKRMFT